MGLNGVGGWNIAKLSHLQKGCCMLLQNTILHRYSLFLWYLICYAPQLLTGLLQLLHAWLRLASRMEATLKIIYFPWHLTLEPSCTSSLMLLYSYEWATDVNVETWYCVKWPDIVQNTMYVIDNCTLCKQTLVGICHHSVMQSIVR